MTQTDGIGTYDRDSFVNVVPFTRQPDGEEIIIGRVDTATFLAVSPGAVEVLDYLANGKSVGEAVDLYCQQHGKICDIGELLAVLEAEGIVDSFGEGKGPIAPSVSTAGSHAGADQGNSPSKRYHFSNFPQPLAQRIFNRWTIAAASILISIGVVLLAQNPSLWPNRDDLYYTHQRTLKLAFLVILSYGGVFIHELAHLIAARAVGANSRIGLGNRLYELVMETDLTALWSIPKRQRYLPLMAGCLVDAVIAALLILLLYASRNGWVVFSGALPFLRIALLSYVARIAWQGLIFVRTDFYYVIVAWLNCRNLLGDTEAYLRNELARVLTGIRIVDQSAIPVAERRIIRFYGVIWIAGRVLALYWLCRVAVPLVCRYVADLAGMLRKYSENPAGFWDALALVLWLVLPVLIGSILWLRSLLLSHPLSRQRTLQHE